MKLGKQIDLGGQIVAPTPPSYFLPHPEAIDDWIHSWAQIPVSAAVRYIYRATTVRVVNLRER